MKVEASGYPNDVQSEEEKEAFIKAYLENQGVSIEKDKVNENNGLRHISKLVSIKLSFKIIFEFSF